MSQHPWHSSPLLLGSQAGYTQWEIIYNVPGSYTFYPPAHVNYVYVELWGAGGGGGAAGTTAAVSSGTAGGNTTFGTLAANGGGLGTGGNNSVSGTAGAAGTYLNGQGMNGFAGEAGNTTAGGAGGNSGGFSMIGSGGARVTTNLTGNPGTIPGGGGGGAKSTSNGAGGGGGGGYTSNVYATADLGGSVSITVGQGGSAGATGLRLGGAGANGAVRIVFYTDHYEGVIPSAGADANVTVYYKHLLLENTGSGGGGASSNTTTTLGSGVAGNATLSTFRSTSLVANGGALGPGTATTQAAGGAASGGDVSVSGTSGGNASVGNSSGGNSGAVASYGGAGVGGQRGASASNPGSNGTPPGGGGGSATISSTFRGGGGGAGYTRRLFVYNNMSGSNISAVSISQAGPPNTTIASLTNLGGYGGNGQIKITPITESSFPTYADFIEYSSLSEMTANSWVDSSYGSAQVNLFFWSPSDANHKFGNYSINASVISAVTNAGRFLSRPMVSNDADMLLLIKPGIANGVGLSVGMLRGSTSGANGYSVAVSNGTNMQLFRFDSGVATQLFLNTSATSYSLNTDWIYVRFQVTGTTIRCRAWKYGQTEPGTWSCTNTDSTYTTGNYGIIFRSTSTNSVCQYDYVGIDYGANTAAIPGVDYP